ncbi:hypothetical protein [Acidiplasma sp.]|uniref:NOB1 family endonuclease n=1 Tax=Acidiplasma sp. TaxID=1872114 RepID=UPI00258D6EC7|nr:hypothetical protein [Acidiplasma sp.]
MEGKKKYIIDTSAILSGKLNISEEGYVYPESVINEIKKGSLEKILEVADITTCSPGKEYIKKAREAALSTGDYNVLSATDIDVIALAIELNGIIITDDYAIQNVAKYCGIDYSGGGISGIKKGIIWKYRCSGCHKIYDEYIKICPICGHEVKRYSKK